MSDVTDRLLAGDRTRSESVATRFIEKPTRTSLDDLVDEAGYLRNRSRLLNNDIAEVHNHALDVQLQARTDEAAKRSVIDLLAELADLGLSWRDIARLVGVSVPALRKWRHGDPASGQNRRAVAQLLAFIDVLRSDHLVQDVASWLEMPLADSGLTGLDVYAAGRHDLLITLAALHLSSEEVLDQFDASWRDRRESQFEIFTADDGQPAIKVVTQD